MNGSATLVGQLIIGLTVLVAAGLAYVKTGGVNKATILALKESNAALTTRLAEIKVELDGLRLALDTTRAENGVLRDALSAKIDVARLVDLIQHHHGTMTQIQATFDERFTAAMLAVGDRLDRNHAAIVDVLTLVGNRRSAPNTRREHHAEPTDD